MGLEESLGNQMKFEDERVQYFSNLWLNQRYSLSIEQKDKIGYAYLKHIIGVDEPTIQSFMDWNLKADHFIGMRQGGAEPRKEDYNNYWKEIDKITPGIYSQSDLSYLIKTADVVGVWTMLFQIDRILKEQSRVINRINVNAHVYK